MKFKMKGINTLINSPLAQKIQNTEYIKDLKGDDFAIKRKITTDPTRGVETPATNDQDYLNSFGNEFANAKKAGYPGDLRSYITNKTEKLGYKGKEVEQKRDYNIGLRQEKGKDGTITYYKLREDGGEDQAYLMGSGLAGRMNYGLDPGMRSSSGKGSGDPKTMITKPEALQLFKDSRGYHVETYDNRNYKKDLQNAMSVKKLENDYNIWLRQQTGEVGGKLVSEPGFVKPTYSNYEEKGDWQNVNKNN